MKLPRTHLDRRRGVRSGGEARARSVFGNQFGPGPRGCGSKNLAKLLPGRRRCPQTGLPAETAGAVPHDFKASASIAKKKPTKQKKTKNKKTKTVDPNGGCTDRSRTDRDLLDVQGHGLGGCRGVMMATARSRIRVTSAEEHHVEAHGWGHGPSLVVGLWVFSRPQCRSRRQAAGERQVRPKRR